MVGYDSVMRLTCDFKANNSAPAKLTTAIYRGGRKALLKKSPTLVLWKVADLLWTRIVVGAEIPFTVDAGEGLRLPHWGRGVILGSRVMLGKNVTLFHRVTIGLGPGGGNPTLGDDVFVGSGTAILGGCSVGNKVRVGANSVITKDIPAGSTVVGANRILSKTA